MSDICCLLRRNLGELNSKLLPSQFDPDTGSKRTAEKRRERVEKNALDRCQGNSQITDFFLQISLIDIMTNKKEGVGEYLESGRS